MTKEGENISRLNKQAILDRSCCFSCILPEGRRQYAELQERTNNHLRSGYGRTLVNKHFSDNSVCISLKPSTNFIRTPHQQYILCFPINYGGREYSHETQWNRQIDLDQIPTILFQRCNQSPSAFSSWYEYCGTPWGGIEIWTWAAILSW